MNSESELKVLESKIKKNFSMLIGAGILTTAFGAIRLGKLELKTILVDFALLLVVFFCISNNYIQKEKTRNLFQ